VNRRDFGLGSDQLKLYRLFVKRTACSSGAGLKGDVCRKTAENLASFQGCKGDSPKGLRIISSLLPKLVVISLSSNLPTWRNSLSAKSTPISSHDSLKAVYKALSSLGSCRPPGKAMWLDHRPWEEMEPVEGEDAGERRMKRSSAVVPG